MISKKQFWDEGYQQGVAFTQLSEEDLNRILSFHDNPKTALDVGCGTGELARQLHARGMQTTGIDLSPAAIEKAHVDSPEEIVFKQLDVDEQDISSLGSFDLIFIKLVLRFVDDPKKLLQQARKALNEGGLLVIINPVVVYEDANMPPKFQKISIPDEETLLLLKEDFVLLDKHSQKASKYTDLVTYIAKTR